jgi:8-oxo-dGTP pyrophosphatase MutT (NUDIX family)
MLLTLTQIYAGRVIQVNLERVQLPNGNIADLEIIHHPGGAAVVALDTEDRVCLLRQFRHAAQGWIWELPAGKIDNREPPFDTVQRELREEAGCQAGRWQSLGRYLSSPGVFTEAIHLYLATELSHVGAQLEEHEVLEVHWKPFDEALAMAVSGEIEDGKTLVGLFKAAHLRHSGLQSEF